MNKFITKIVSFVAALSIIVPSTFAPLTAMAADTGFNSPSTSPAPENWSNEDNAFTSNNAYATESSDDDDQGYATFNFSAIPAGSTIDGIEVKAEAYSFVNSTTLTSGGTFGTGSTASDVASWDEDAVVTNPTVALAIGSGDDTVSPDGGRFARIADNGWICQSVDGSGLTGLTLNYYWRGDVDAEDGESATVQYKTGNSCANSGSWTTLATHELDDADNDATESWSSLQSVSVPSLNTFVIRFKNGDQSSDDENFRVDGVSLTGAPANSSCQLRVRIGEGGDFSAYKTATLTGAETIHTFGGSADLWSESWIPGDFTNANFGLQTQFNDPDANCDSNAEVRLDHIQAKVYYTPAVVNTIDSLTLVNSTSDADIETIDNGDVFNYDTIGVTTLSIRANATPSTDFGSVVFDFDGAATANDHTENEIPWTANGNTGADYVAITPILALGEHTVTVTPYSGANGTGTAGTSLTRNFKIIENEAGRCADGIDNDGDEMVDGADVIDCPAVEEPTGSIQITKYDCPADTATLRSVNGVGGTVPTGCTVQSGVTFSYVHGESSNNSDDATGELADAVAGNEDGIGTTNGSGILTFSGVAATGRYLVYESDESGVQLSSSEIINLYCQGDGEGNDAAHDNQELTFVTDEGTARCVAYNRELTTTGHIIVTKETNLGDDSTEFGFTATGGEFSEIFTLGRGESKDIEVAAGTYSITEDSSFPGWTLSGATCSDESNPSSIELSAGETVTCTFTNNYNSETMGHLIVRKTLVNAPEGVTPLDFAFTLDNEATYAFEADGQNSITITPGIYNVIELPYDNYTTTYSGSCSEVNVTSESESTPLCTITNTYTGSEETNDEDTLRECTDGIDNDENEATDAGDEMCGWILSHTASVIVKKHVINDSGSGTKSASDFTITATKGGVQVDTFPGSESGKLFQVLSTIDTEPTSYSFTEPTDNDYSPYVSGTCSGSIELGQHLTCIIENNDINPGAGGDNGGRNDNNGSVQGASTETPNDGQVLGALACSSLTYEQLITIKNGEGANPEIVKALQEWLNSSQNAGLTVNGIYDAPTKFAIMLLQEKYSDETLKPWGLTKATGHVWKTTAALIMKLVCGENIETGALVPFTH